MFVIVLFTCGYSLKCGTKNDAVVFLEDEQLDYEKMVQMENEQMGKLLEENYEAVNPPENREDAPEEVIGDTGHRNKAVEIDYDKLRDFECLCKTFYQIDSTTQISKKQLDLDKLLEMDMSLNEQVDGPQILIYHTHSQEAYSDSVAGDVSTGVVGVGELLKNILETQYGFSVLHHTGEYDVGDREHAYSNAEPAIKDILKENPTIQLVIDLHRDGVSENTRLVTEVDGRKTAQIMFFNGLSRTKAMGDIEYLKNPYINTELALSLKLQIAAAEYFPGLTRRIYLKGYRYNMHLCEKSILVEVGAQTNTVEEAMNAMYPLAEIINKVIRE